MDALDSARAQVINGLCPTDVTLARHRDPQHRTGRWPRRAGLVALSAIPLGGLLNVFGQRPDLSTAATAGARLQVYAPTAARSGIVYAARFRVDALRELTKATLILDPGWAEQYTVNGVAPQPIGEGSHDGKLLFTLGHIPRGQHYTLFVSLQVNPTNVGHHDQTVWLFDRGTRLVVLHREITIWP